MQLNMLDYQKLILIKGASLFYLKDRTIEYGEIVGGETRTHHIGIMHIDATDWHLIACPSETSFYVYHNLMSWYEPKDNACNICVAIHQDAQLSYYAVIKELQWGDTLIGRFQDGRGFSIDLPAAFQEGSMQPCHNRLKEASINSYLKSCGFEPEWLEKASDGVFEFVDVDIAG